MAPSTAGLRAPRGSCGSHRGGRSEARARPPQASPGGQGARPCALRTCTRRWPPGGHRVTSLRGEPGPGRAGGPGASWGRTAASTPS